MRCSPSKCLVLMFLALAVFYIFKWQMHLLNRNKAEHFNDVCNMTETYLHNLEDLLQRYQKYN